MIRRFALRGAVALGLGVVLGVVLGAGSIACGPSAPPPPPARRENVAQWADVFEGTPDIYAVVRPQALKRDRLYGSFWKSLMRVAQARGFARGATMTEAADGAEEIIVGISKRGDAALILRGVPASLDPLKITDDGGQPLFRAVDERSKVVEYVATDPRMVDRGSLFVLPDRTWVGTIGDARARARQAFATPLHRPAPTVEADALVSVRFASPVTHALDRQPGFAVLSKKLASATLTLKPNKGGLVVALLYEEPDQTAQAEMHAKGLVEELSKDTQRFGWLKDASVRYDGNSVYIRVAIPPRLLEELPNASGADLPF